MECAFVAFTPPPKYEYNICFVSTVINERFIESNKF